MQTTRPTPAPAIDRPAPSPLPPSGREIQPTRQPRWVLWVAGLGVLVLVASVIGSRLLAGGSQTGDGKAPTTLAVTPTQLTVAFGFVDVEPGVSYLYPTQHGRVTKILVEENQLIEKDEVIFRIDDRHQREQVNKAEAAVKGAEKLLEQARLLPERQRNLIKQQEAAVAAAESTLRQANIAHDKAKRLQGQDLTNKEEVDARFEDVRKAEAGVTAAKEKLAELRIPNPEHEVKAAEAKVDAARADLELARLALDECAVKAPEKGTVLRMMVSVGDLLGPNPKQPAVIFCPDRPRIIRAEIAQEDAAKVAVGQTAKIEDDARQAGEWSGKVKRVSDWFSPRRSILLEPRQMNDVRTLECIIELDPNQPTLKIGQRVRVILGK